MSEDNRIYSTAPAPLSAYLPGTNQNPKTRTYLYICRLGCSNRRIGTRVPFVDRTLQCRRKGRRLAGHTPGSSRIRRGCVARPVRTLDLCWRTGTGTHNATGPGTRRGETDGREHRWLGQQRDGGRLTKVDVDRKESIQMET